MGSFYRLFSYVRTKCVTNLYQAGTRFFFQFFIQLWQFFRLHQLAHTGWLNDGRCYLLHINHACVPAATCRANVQSLFTTSQYVHVVRTGKKRSILSSNIKHIVRTNMHMMGGCVTCSYIFTAIGYS